MGGLVLAMGAGVALWATLDKTAQLPTGQNPTVKGQPVDNRHQCPPICTKEAELARAKALYPFHETALQKLQWLADESRCHVSDNAALMAGCVRERIAKVRAKALAYKERYEALRDLDQVYFQNLHKDGLVPMTIHITPDAVGNGLGHELR